jgi:glutathione S-transferase
MLGLPNMSSFCLKLETWLRMAGLPYENRYTNDPREAPLGKLPCLKVDNRTIPDTALCIDYLKHKHGIDLDRSLTPAQKAQSHALKALLEDRLYYAGLYSRWVDARYWPEFRDTLFGKLPFPVRKVLPQVIQQKMKRDLQGQGIAKHPPEQVYAFAAQDIAVLSALLGDQPYFFGDEPTEIDASAFGLIAQLTLVTRNTPWPPLVAPYPNLRAYAERMLQRYFP